MITSLWAYITAITLLTLTPGVDTFLVIRNTNRGGWRDGVVSSLGICCGLFGHACLSAVGVSVLLLHSAWAFHTLKFAGALYLVWLGLTSLYHAVKAPGSSAGTSLQAGDSLFSPGRSFVEGMASNLMNPKAIIFYMAFLPQFIDPGRSALVQMMFLAGIHFGIAMIWQSVLASMVDKAKSLVSKPGFRRILDSLSGSILLFFGVKLGLGR